MNKINFLKIQTLKTTYLEKEREKKKKEHTESMRGVSRTGVWGQRRQAYLPLESFL